MLPHGASERFVATNGVRLHVVEAGPADGPLVVLLHGFPELWYGWRRQIGPLAEAGYRVLVPDQRGYNLSEKPRGVSAYRLDALAGDVLGLIDDAGRDRAAVVGHDWGAVVAWWLALTHAERLERLAILNVPHPAVMRRHLRSSLRQLRRSWYIFFFQLPWLPELFLRRRGFRNAVRALRASRPGTFGDVELAVYREAWGQPRALRSMVHWYRGALQTRSHRPPSLRVAVETLMLWGCRDVALGREMAQPSIELCDRGRLILFEQASHWIQHEQAESVNRLLLRFLEGGLAAVDR